MRFFLFLLLFQILALAEPEPVRAGPWVKLSGCTLAPGYMDGDSFHVLSPQGEFTARLYFVDCPETDLSFPDRVEEQAKAMGVSTEKALEIGKEATAFTRKTLSKPFTIFTRWRSAGGRSQRFAVMIQLDGGKWLCEELVRAGLARVYGIRTPPPPETGAEDSREWIERLSKGK